MDQLVTAQQIANELDTYIGTDWRDGVLRGIISCGGAATNYDGVLWISESNASTDFGDDDTVKGIASLT